MVVEMNLGSNLGANTQKKPVEKYNDDIRYPLRRTGWTAWDKGRKKTVVEIFVWNMMRMLALMIHEDITGEASTILSACLMDEKYAQ